MVLLWSTSQAACADRGFLLYPAPKAHSAPLERTVYVVLGYKHGAPLEHFASRMCGSRLLALSAPKAHSAPLERTVYVVLGYKHGAPLEQMRPCPKEYLIRQNLFLLRRSNMFIAP